MNRYICSAVAVLALAACSSDDGVSPGNPALVQFVNASSSGAVTPVLDGTTLGGSLGFQESSTTCVQVPSSHHNIEFQSGGTTIVQTGQYTFNSDARYTVVFTSPNRPVVISPVVVDAQPAGSY